MSKKYYVERKADNVWVVAAEDGSDAQEFNEHGRATRHCIAMSDTEAQAEIARLNAAAVVDAARIAELEKELDGLSNSYATCGKPDCAPTQVCELFFNGCRS